MPDLRSSLLLGADDTLTWDVPSYQRGAATLLLELIQPASFPASGKGLLYLGNAAVTGGYWVIESTGSQYRTRYHNGTTDVSSTMSGTAPAVGEHVWLRATRDGEGRVQLHQHLGWVLDEETSAAQSGVLALVAYGEPTQLRLNGIGNANRTAFTALRTVLAAGDWALEDLVNRF